MSFVLFIQCYHLQYTHDNTALFWGVVAAVDVDLIISYCIYIVCNFIVQIYFHVSAAKNL